jgi:hypothetical protein
VFNLNFLLCVEPSFFECMQMPPRPSTPVLARHASTEEDIPYVQLQLFVAHCQSICNTFPRFQRAAQQQSSGLASSAIRTRVQAVEGVSGQQLSPLSTARVAWGSPGK